MERFRPKRNIIWNGNQMASMKMRMSVTQRMHASWLIAKNWTTFFYSRFTRCLIKSVLLTLLKTLLCMTRESRRCADTTSSMVSSVRKGDWQNSAEVLFGILKVVEKHLLWSGFQNGFLQIVKKRILVCLSLQTETSWMNRLKRLISVLMKRLPEQRVAMTCFRN